ncbi:hypothetical protein RFI_37379 [Reticulomyxa filosa]|uniref:Uncharacterized protein n=1 Tax=Reticulomyxa filosa TaxID=46433 RepID=X6LH71_RETFI|nr:hypothetical protein RFI_37379 [Reticulomyxa filosa]|eukprot:ETO00080.1 hypothetical protein RFI_37379 [Reticulomyxa filosa]
MNFIILLKYMPNGLVSFSIILGTSSQLILLIEMFYQIQKHTKYLYQLSTFELPYISNSQEFNSFNVIWKDRDNRKHKKPLNPYSITFKQGMQQFKDKLRMRDHFITGKDELLYHDDIHKQMGYPLQLHEICANFIVLCYGQIQFRHHNWPYLDWYLRKAIEILHSHERREESEMELYCGLKRVRLENIKEIKSGNFISHVSISDDIQVTKMFRSNQGCFLHFHPSMRRAFSIQTWNAKVGSEAEYTQMILLTCVLYDQYIQQIMQISAMWNHSIDLNLIYAILLSAQEKIALTIEYLSAFEEWKCNQII